MTNTLMAGTGFHCRSQNSLTDLNLEHALTKNYTCLQSRLYLFMLNVWVTGAVIREGVG